MKDIVCAGIPSAAEESPVCAHALSLYFYIHHQFVKCCPSIGRLGGAGVLTGAAESGKVTDTG